MCSMCVYTEASLHETGSQRARIALTPYTLRRVPCPALTAAALSPPLFAFRPRLSWLSGNS